MRLTFPSGEHAAVNIEQGQVGVGSASGGGASVTIAGLSPLHAVFATDRRGRWLTVPKGAKVIINGRPVKRIAYLRPGDLVCLGAIQVRVESGEPPAVVPDPEPAPRHVGLDNAGAGAKIVLRGLSGPWFGRAATLASPRLLGRGAGSDIRLDGAGVQERHAIIDIENGVVVVRTAAPDAGLRVNGHLVRSAFLAAGDQIEIGEHRFSIEAPGHARLAENSVIPVLDRRVPSPASTATMRMAESSLSTPTSRDLGGVYLLIAAAAALAAALTAFFVYAPRG